MLLQELIDLKARRDQGVLIDRLKWGEILDWAIEVTAHHEGVEQSNPIADDDGWIEHTTGKQPVADDVMVDIFVRKEIESGHQIEVLPASCYDWTCKDQYEILKYRVIE